MSVFVVLYPSGVSICTFAAERRVAHCPSGVSNCAFVPVSKHFCTSKVSEHLPQAAVERECRTSRRPRTCAAYRVRAKGLVRVRFRFSSRDDAVRLVVHEPEARIALV